MVVPGDNKLRLKNSTDVGMKPSGVRMWTPACPWCQPPGSTAANDAKVPNCRSEMEQLTWAVTRTPEAFRYILPVRDPSDSPLVQRNVYEGGKQVWECSIDLLNFLSTKASATGPRRVLELGAGHGLPSAWALRRGAEMVTLQDLNCDALESCALPNILANCAVDAGVSCSEVLKRVRFLAGAWAILAGRSSPAAAGGGLMADDEDNRYDLILCADALYREENYADILAILRASLARDGEAFFATKRYYFGLGGGTFAFLEAINRGASKEMHPPAQSSSLLTVPSIEVEALILGSPSPVLSEGEESTCDPRSGSRSRHSSPRPPPSRPASVRSGDLLSESERSEDGREFSAEIALTVEDGQSNIRDLIRVHHFPMKIDKDNKNTENSLQLDKDSIYP